LPRPLPPNQEKPVIIWLGVVYTMIMAMVFIGGLTRLTGSGLSMVDWRPLMGAIPPLDEASWNAVFGQYQSSPEFEQVNQWMTLSDFKKIFWWEYIHRALGRAIGVVFLCPWLYFLAKKRFAPGFALKSFFAFLLGGLQGLMGWYMVRSGLVGTPEVSHLRLAAHLLLAFATAMWVLWLILDLSSSPRPRRAAQRPWMFRVGLSLFGLTFLQIGYGALMAGTHAGHVASDFPWMNGEWIPAGLSTGGDTFWGLIYNPVTIHFVHRTLGWMIAGIAILLAVFDALQPTTRRVRYATGAVVFMVCLQFSLGIMTVMTGVSITAAILHQLGAFILLSTILVFVDSTGRQPC
jgi:heme a synthase